MTTAVTWFSYLVVILLVSFNVQVAGEILCEQLHLSYTGVESSLSLDFVSVSEEFAEIHYRSASNNGNVHSSITTSSFFDEIGWLHFGEMRELTPHDKYEYMIFITKGNGFASIACTDWIEFEAGYPVRRGGSHYRIGDGETVGSTDPEGSIAAVYADFGLANDVSMAHLKDEGKRGAFDYALHIGDISYDLFTNKSTVGNEFMRQVSSVYQHKPLMVATGNHEHNDNFVQYTQRFKAQEVYAGANSKSGTSFYYSFDVGLIHYVVINTEVYKYANQTAKSPLPFTPEEQLAWLEKDLVQANANRDNVPWIVMAGHKGWYMNEFSVSYKINGDICTNFTGFDDLACKYGVDLYLTGHVHVYQRFLPVVGPSNLRFMMPPRHVDYDSVSADGHTYTNSKYMPTIVAASPGDEEITGHKLCPLFNTFGEFFWRNSQVKCSAVYGYGHLQAVNKTHLYWEFVETGMNGKTDSYTRDDVQAIIASLPKDWMQYFVNQTDNFEEELTKSIIEHFNKDKHTYDDPTEFWTRGVGDVVRDYLWIVQTGDKHNGQKKAYCDL